MAEDKCVLLAELIVCFVINAVAGIYMLAGSQTLKQLFDLLDKQKANGDVWLVACICEAWKYNLTVFCSHANFDDLVLEFPWKVTEGEGVIDLAVFHDKHPRNQDVTI